MLLLHSVAYPRRMQTGRKSESNSYLYTKSIKNYYATSRLRANARDIYDHKLYNSYALGAQHILYVCSCIIFFIFTLIGFVRFGFCLISYVLFSINIKRICKYLVYKNHEAFFCIIR
jgi:hypothetical protein